MSELQTTTLCPSCGSAKTEAQDDVVKCMNCGWEGTPNELITAMLPNDPSTIELDPDAALNVARQIAEHYMKLLHANISKTVGGCIIQAGLCGVKDTKNLTRLIRAAVMGAYKATLEEEDQIAEEYSADRILS